MNGAWDRFDRAVRAARSAYAVRDWESVLQWRAAAMHAWDAEVAPTLIDDRTTGLLASRLERDLDDVLTLAARSQLAAAGTAPDALTELVSKLEADMATRPALQELPRLAMVALHRLGRDDEALALYEQTAATLRASTGLDPGHALQQVRDILLGGGSLPPQDEDQPFVVATKPDGSQHVVTLPAAGTGPLRIGRVAEADLAITWDAQVSRRHAEIRHGDDAHLLVDVGSSNGTTLNGRPLHDPLRLVDGDLIRVGSTTVLYRNPGDPAAAAVPIASGTMVRVMPTPSSVLNPRRDAEPVDELDVTVFFCDMRGWTAASGQLSPQRARGLLDAFYDLGAEVVTRHGGTVLQMAGDEVYACFGAPTPDDDHARRALRAALDMQASHAAFEAEVTRQGLPSVRFGVGLNSGPVAPFAIGTADRRQLGLVGTTVNVAARLCSVADAGEVVYSVAVLERLGGEGPGEPIGPLDLKNVAAPVHARRVAATGPV